MQCGQGQVTPAWGCVSKRVGLRWGHAPGQRLTNPTARSINRGQYRHRHRRNTDVLPTRYRHGFCHIL